MNIYKKMSGPLLLSAVLLFQSHAFGASRSASASAGDTVSRRTRARVERPTGLLEVMNKVDFDSFLSDEDLRALQAVRTSCCVGDLEVKDSDSLEVVPGLIKRNPRLSYFAFERPGDIISDDLLAEITNLTVLNHLRLKAYFLDDEALLATLKGLPELELLELIGIEGGVANVFVRALNEGLRFESVKHVGLEGSEVTAEQLAALLQVCPNVEYLSFDDSKGVLAGFTKALEACPDLSMTSLKEIICARSRVGQESLVSMLKLCPNLKELGLDFSPGVIAAFRTAKERYPDLKLENLKILNLYSAGDNTLSEEDVAAMREVCPALNIIMG